MYKKMLICFACAAFVISAAVTGFNINNRPIVTEISGSIPAMSEDEIILNSDLVVKGTVSNIGKSRWSNPEHIEGKRNILQTDVEIKVNEIISGEYSQDEVIVRINKGYDKETNVKMISEGYPDFVKGEKVLVFLARDDGDLATDENYFVLTGMKQGKYKIKGSSTFKNEVYEGDKGEINLNGLKEKIDKVLKDNPNYKEIKQQKMEETIRNNKELFGE